MSYFTRLKVWVNKVDNSKLGQIVCFRSVMSKRLASGPRYVKTYSVFTTQINLLFTYYDNLQSILYILPDTTPTTS